MARSLSERAAMVNTRSRGTCGCAREPLSWGERRHSHRMASGADPKHVVPGCAGARSVIEGARNLREHPLHDPVSAYHFVVPEDNGLRVIPTARSSGMAATT